MRVFLIGAAGGVGRRLAKRLSELGFEVSGMVRKPTQSDVVAQTGATAVQGDLIRDSVEELADKFAGHDAIVFSAGAHGTGMDQTTLIDGEGLEKSVDAAIAADVNRFVLVSVFPEAGRESEPKESFEHYMKVKKQSDVYLTRTNLDWLIVRPGTLSDEQGDGRVSAGVALEYGVVRRDNVASFIVAALRSSGLSRLIVELTDGSTPVEDAVSALLSKP